MGKQKASKTARDCDLLTITDHFINGLFEVHLFY